MYMYGSARLGGLTAIHLSLICMAVRLGWNDCHNICLLFLSFSNVCHSVCVWPTSLKVGSTATFHILFPMKGFIFLI